MVATSGKGWRLAPSLVALVREVDARWPKRPKTYDGSIGDAAHAARKSEHNPDRDPDPMPAGMVSAVDITRASAAMARELLAELIGDSRVWYVIHDGHIYSRTHGWAKRPYDGPNPHTHHVHVSLVQSAAAASDVTTWLKASVEPKPAPKPAPKPEPVKPATQDPTAGQKATDEHRPGSRALRWGDRGTDVALLQRFIGIDDDGVFGPVTAKAVRRYQSTRGDAPSGIVSGRTWAPILRALGLS